MAKGGVAAGSAPTFVQQGAGGKALQQGECLVAGRLFHGQQGFALGPPSQLAGPVLAIALELLGCNQAVEQGHQIGRTGLARSFLQRLQASLPALPLLQQGLRVFATGHRLAGCALALCPQGLELVEQRLRVCAQRLQSAQLVQGHAVKPGAPIVLHGRQAQCIAVFHAALLEQTGAVKSVLLQHAAAPAVDGEDGGVVHPLRRQVQALGAGGPGLRRVLRAQAMQEVVCRRVRLFHAFEEERGLRQAFAHAAPQLRGGGVGKGHHQNLRRVQPCLAPMAQHQAHIEGRQGPGLAGAGGGFYDLQAGERHGQGIQRNRHLACRGRRDGRSRYAG